MFDSRGDALPGTPGECVAALEELEALKAHLAARQARITAHLDDLQAGASDRSVGAQVALARHESPHRGTRLRAMACTLVDDLPHVLAALEQGLINEHRAEILAGEADHLHALDRPAYDTQLGELLATGAPLGDRALRLAAQRIAMRLDDQAAAKRRERAHRNRHVTAQRRDDGTAQITATVSDVHAAAIMQSLHARAAQEQAAQDTCDEGEERSFGQVVADLFVARLTGQVTAVATPIALNLVVSAEALLGDGPGADEPAEIVPMHGGAGGPIPASVARRLLTCSPDTSTRIRRLFADTEHLVAMESTSRTFDGLLRQFVTLRDRTCRTPWCNAPIRQIDHITPDHAGGPTSATNGQGLCTACNQLKEEPGWTHQSIHTDDLDPHEVEITSPAGQTTRTRAPDPPGLVPPEPTWVETWPGHWVLIA
ncbi:hypothetical protein I601_4078 [Nocardioides dokdonensis FR1436]|uniref:HNH nuclease domain-containing protein n=1 Tax=Nocardioides dokdonensis FR1436 TaxID=1300347 RepID=A0A1A9GQ84_9ACTN|nr:HNH endonuclease signature motif containing protein [Nocardioides dokdonensis]ANH40474.1 hypothetical protein I601_4078 [Nocardioides dokdonensis FR1436]